MTDDGAVLRLTPIRWLSNGEEPLPLHLPEFGGTGIDSHMRPREWRFSWVGDGKAAFELTNSEAKVSPWGSVSFRQRAAAPGPLPSAPLRGISRVIRKEPTYAGRPEYCLIALGPDAGVRVWLVLDGETLYVDRNGNGDLTDLGEKLPPPMRLGGETLRFSIGDLFGAPGVTLTVGRVKGRTASATIEAGVGQERRQQAGPGGLRFTASPADARVIHLGGRSVGIWFSGASNSRVHASWPALDAAQPIEFRVQVGTSGIGNGSMASFLDSVPRGVHPWAEFEFSPRVQGGQPVRLRAGLRERDGSGQFSAVVGLPEGVEGGPARVTLTFPNCPWGEVAPVTQELDIIPRPRPAEALVKP